MKTKKKSGKAGNLPTLYQLIKNHNFLDKNLQKRALEGLIMIARRADIRKETHYRTMQQVMEEISEIPSYKRSEHHLWVCRILAESCHWEKTPQGFDFWNKVWKELWSKVQIGLDE